MNNYTLLLLLLCLALTCCQKADPGFEERLTTLRGTIDQLGQEDLYSGVVLLTRGDETLLEEAYGLADQKSKEAIGLDTKFNLASMNKMFTAVAIMQLRESGKLGLQDLVGQHLPDYPDISVRDSVTIEQLLTHTSGLGDFFNEKFEQREPASVRTLDDYHSLFVGDPLNFKPGEGFAYSNAGYIVLGLIIEQIAGRNYYDHIKEEIFIPLAMNDSGWGHSDTIVPGLAKAYVQRDSLGFWQENPYLAIKGSSAGGGFSTVGDLSKFVKALKSNSLVSANTLAEMTDDRFENGYGYGFSLRELNGWKVYGHNGGFPGVSGEVDIFDQDDLVAISLSNRGPRSGWATMRSHLREAIVGKTEESQSFQRAEQVVATYEAEGQPAALALAESFAGELDERQLIHHSEQYYEAGERLKGIDILEIVVQSFPESWFPVSIMADLQIEGGDTTTAVANYKKSLALNPDNRWATDRLKELGE
ncbi:serine hydrolase domain-containing protein [Neolewinella persica]|uniref:serine hydrolase domain-containing protein n=1 Tax=Neolewinella persica TaxID=70998 RepID=UPI0003816C8B|nr:serine hydrolase domain-containing protein [Neolewinella persica]